MCYEHAALYVAGFSLSRHNELLQLLLPEKLLAADKQVNLITCTIIIILSGFYCFHEDVAS